MNYSDYIDEAIAYVKENFSSNTEAAYYIIDKYKIEKTNNAVRKAIGEKIRSNKHAGLEDECEIIKAPSKNVGLYWVKTKGYSMLVKNDLPDDDLDF